MKVRSIGLTALATAFWYSNGAVGNEVEEAARGGGASEGSGPLFANGVSSASSSTGRDEEGAGVAENDTSLSGVKPPMRLLSQSKLLLATVALGPSEATNADEVKFIADKTKLEYLKNQGPTIVRHQAHANHQDFVADIVSIGSTTRPELMSAQVETWASTHVSIRNFWGFTEHQDFASLDGIDFETHEKVCKFRDLGFEPSLETFVHQYYGLGEAGKDHLKDEETGWVWSQRRLGRALGWLQSQYEGDKASTIPDALMIVDDDTYLDVDRVKKLMIMESGDVTGTPLARAACLFAEGEGSALPFSFAYGGFGLFLNKQAIQMLTKPLHCEAISNKALCSTLQENRIGELRVFKEGMTVLDLFYKYSALEEYCLHSDWLMGYIIKYYLYPQTSHAKELEYTGTSSQLLGMNTHPGCGNFTSTGVTRPCHEGSAACHKQTPEEMESLALSSYTRTRSSFNKIPNLSKTKRSETTEMVSKKQESENMKTDLVLPNVLLIGAQKAGTSSVATWLFHGGVCRPENLDDEHEMKYYKEVHFFDHKDRYKQGIPFLSKRFEYCKDAKHRMDATPETLKEPQRVYDFYKSAGKDTLDSLKLILILREPVSREMSLYNHKMAEYLKTQEKAKWFSDIAFNNGTVMSFDQYSEDVLVRQLRDPKWKSPSLYVDHISMWFKYFDRDQLLILAYDEVKDDPGKAQWRIQQFLGTKIEGKLPKVNIKEYVGKSQIIPARASQVLEPLFYEKNQELYKLLDNSPGPWMEDYPFSRFEKRGPKFAYATVLGRNPDEAQNQMYLDATLVLIRSLSLSSKADIVVLMMYQDKEAEQMLKDAGALLKHINKVPYAHKVDHFEPYFIDITLAKLRAFQMTEYERVQLIDVDVSIEERKNIDMLFDYAPSSKLVSEGLGGDSPLRAGWILLKPNLEDFNQLQSILDRGKFDEHLGWDHIDLPVRYPGWSRDKDAITKWGFYGSQLEQGLLYHYFYALQKATHPKAIVSDLLLLLDDQELYTHGIVHMYGNRKPWIANTNSQELPDFVQSAQVQWRKVYSTLKSNPIGRLEFDSPLTQVGNMKYHAERVLYDNSYPSKNPTKMPTSPPAAGSINHSFTGVLSVNTNVCGLSMEGLDNFKRGTEVAIDSTIPQGKTTVTRICNQPVRRALSSRMLQQDLSAWQVEYEIVISNILCGSQGCASDQVIASINTIVGSISNALSTSIQSGNFADVLSSNANIVAALQSSGILGCLVAWGTVHDTPLPKTVITITNTTGQNMFYPDWSGGDSGTCLNDGNEPRYMTLDPSAWLYDALEGCCSRYYSGWNEPKCLGNKGTGLWHVDYVSERCVVDCPKGSGDGVCGGIAPPISSELYNNPRECCSAKLGWVFLEFCESDSLKNQCYIGTGKYYRASSGDDLCVRDCPRNSGGDATCGGIVDAMWVRLHETAEACCSTEHSWIEEELCAARSRGSGVEMFWADQANSKCVKDSETKAKDLSVRLFETAEACCSGLIGWISLAQCTADANGLTLSERGSGKYYVEWQLEKCAKECQGPAPCGKIDPAGVGSFYDTLSECCEQLHWIERNECVLA